RNGYRMLHDVLSGTRVVSLPPPRPALRRTAEAPAGQKPPPRPADDLPRQLGVFQVLGVLRRGAAGAPLLAADPAPGPQGWGGPGRGGGPGPAARRDLARPARLRWLTGGQQAGWQWDAFLTPAGERLTDRAAGRPFRWPEARRLLEQLADELEAADADGTTPP